MRGFKIIQDAKIEFNEILLPKRATNRSAGYDFYLPMDVVIKSKESVVVNTFIKAYMQEDEVLLMIIRSSLGFHKGLRLKNQVGVIDSDYYENPTNDGHIMVAIENTSNETVKLQKGERFVQGIFVKYLQADEDEPISNNRIGGMGSTKF